MLTPEDMRNLNLQGVAITAEITPTGELQPVDQDTMSEKLLAAAREWSLPRIHTVVVAHGQLGVPDDLKRDDPNAEFLAPPVHTLEEAVHRLQIDAQTRWGAIPDYNTLELRRHRDFVGRTWLQDQVEAAIRRALTGQGPAYILLTGIPGVGKSAFIAWQVQHQPAAIYHFIRRDMGNWDDPDAILRTLTAQLRRILALPVTQNEEDLSLQEAFLCVLQRASRRLADGQHLVLWLDGLDEAFGPTGRFTGVALPGMLPRSLPPGVVVVLTSRLGDHLAWLANPTLCTEIPLAADAPANREDIRTYLRQQNEARRLGLTADLLERLTEASEGCFAAAVLYLYEDPRLREKLAAWQADPGLIPRGLDGWLVEQWQWLLAAAGQMNISPEVVRGVLGLLATAREPLSLNHLHAFLRAAGDGPIGFLSLIDLSRHLEAVLRLSREFFEPVGPEAGAAARYRFFHTRFPEFVLEQLSDVEQEDLHRILAAGCAGWARFHKPEVQAYALRHRLAHLIAAWEWKRLPKSFAEADFIVERSKRFGFAEVYADALAAAEHSGLPQAYREAFSEWERFLRWRIERLQHFPAAYPQEVLNEFLPAASTKPSDELLEMLSRSIPLVLPSLCLRKTFGPPALSSTGHVTSVMHIAYSPDGRFVVSGSFDGTVKVWDAQTGHLVADCMKSRGAVSSMAFSPNGRFMALSSAWGHTVRVWDVQTGQLVADCVEHTDCVNSLAFSPDGQFMASGSDDGMVKVWEAQTWQMGVECVGHERSVRSVAFSPDGRSMVSGSDDHTVKVWDARMGWLVADCVGHQAEVYSVAFSPSGRFVASGSGDKTVKIWETQTGLLVADCTGHTAKVNRIAYSPDGEFVVSGSDDHTVKVWEAQTGWLVADCVGHQAEVHSVAFSPSGRFVISGGYSDTVKVWEMQTGQLVTDCPKHPDSMENYFKDYLKYMGSMEVALSPDGRFVASGYLDVAVRVWEVQTGRLVARCEGEHTYVRQIAFSSDGRFVALSWTHGALTVEEAQTGQEVANCMGYEATVNDVAFSPDGQFVVSGSDDHTVKVWKAQTGQQVANCMGHEAKVYGVAFSPDGQFVVSGSDDHTVKVWKAQTGRLVADCVGHTDDVGSVAFSPNGQFVVSGSGDHTVKVWEAQTGQLVADCVGHKSPPYRVAFSPDGQFVASGDRDNTVKVWEAQTGRLVADCVGHRSWVNSVAFSPNGQFVVSGSEDHMVKVWDVQTGMCVNTLFFDRPLFAVAFLTAFPPRLAIADCNQRIFEYKIAVF